MTTEPRVTPASQRSRLDPEPVPRRDFLGLAAMWATGAAFLFSFLGMARLPKAAVLPSPSRKFKVTIPDSLAAGAPLIPPGRSVAIYRDAEGSVHAISTVCTHLGCIVRAEADGFHCPCHGSQFHPDGSLKRGPAPRGLPWLAVASAGPGVFVVDEGTTVPPGTKATA